MNIKGLELFCVKESCRTEKIYGAEGKTYYIETSPQKMLFFDTFKVGKWSGSKLAVGTHVQYYCSCCFSVKGIVFGKDNQINYIYENEPLDT